MDDPIPTGSTRQSLSYPIWGSCRMIFTICAFFGLANLTMMRASLSFTLGEFNWKKDLEGRLNAAIFYGFILTQGFAGYFCDRFGGKLLFILGVVLQSAGSLLCPIAARMHPEFLFVVRIVQGLSGGFCIPSMFVLFSKWCPPAERTMLLGLAYAGFPLGYMIAYPMASTFCRCGIDGGWPLLFYTIGIFGAILGIIFYFIIFSNPNEHPRITPEEREYLNSLIIMKTNKHLLTPWSSILRSKPVYAYFVAHFCQSWGFITISSNIPMMLKDMLDLDLKANGLLSALPYACAFVTRLSVGLLFKPVLNLTKLSITNMRKVNHLLGTMVPGICLICLSFLTCDQRNIALFLLATATSFTDIGFTGSYLLSYLELAPQFAGLLTGVSNAIGTTPGCISNTLVGYLTKNGTREEWVSVLCIMATLYFIGGIFYAIFGSSKLQPWAKIQQSDGDKSVA